MSRVTYTGNGSTVAYNVTFPYLRKEHVKVYVGGDQPDFTWANDTRIQFALAPASGAQITIQRETPAVPLHTIQDDRPVPARVYNELVLQAIYHSAERNGTQGVPGPTGPAGPRGPAGPAGPTGPQGPIGAQGPAGTAGARGDRGATGAVGPQGPIGPQGPAGPAGPTGAQGPQGQRGVQGPEGPQGPQGLRGLQGYTGAQGPAGPEGPRGPEGPQGPQGIRGPQGHKGDKGDAGKSFEVHATGLDADRPNYLNEPEGFAYLATDTGQLYIRQGAGWSLPVAFGRGDQGPQGPQGIEGPMGPTGPQGIEGPQGPQGVQGPQGLQGPQGEKGMNWKGAWSATAVYLRDDVVTSEGNAYIAVADTVPVGTAVTTVAYWATVVTRGAQGPQGVQGPIGPEGPEGPKGDTGPAGPAGPQGPAGTTSWNDLTDKPSTYAPASHNHNTLYYTKTEIDAMIALLAPKANPTFTGTIVCANIDSSGAITAQGNISAYT